MFVKNLTKSYSENIVLQNFSYDFKDNNITCIMGKSGCGKTTLLNILMGLLKPDSGEIDPKFNRKISAVFQENRLCENLNAAANIKMVCDKNISLDDICNSLINVGIDRESIFKPVSELSGGMKRRTAIVRAIMADNDILIFDEPFKGLDSDTLNLVIGYVIENRNSRTMIMVTHSNIEIDLLKSIDNNLEIISI